MPLKEMTFGEMLDAGILPSGHQFELMPDNVGVALATATVTDPKAWREKAMQVKELVKSLDGRPVSEIGLDGIMSLNDTDVTFLSLAWTAEVNGRALKLSQGVECPNCSTPFTKIDLSPLKIMMHESPVDGPSCFSKVEFSEDDDLEKLPTAAGTEFYVKAPTWSGARSRVPESSQSKPEIVDFFRAIAAAHASPTGGKGSPRQLGRAEINSMPTFFLQALLRAMKLHIPHIVPTLDIKCASCRTDIEIPLAEAGSLT